jgi:hypothetical protein
MIPGQDHLQSGVGGDLQPKTHSVGQHSVRSVVLGRSEDGPDRHFTMAGRGYFPLREIEMETNNFLPGTAPCRLS